MDETKYVAVPVELSAEMLEAWERRGIERVKLAMAGVESITPYRTSIKETYAVAIAAAPTTHVAVKRELLERAVSAVLLYHGNSHPLSRELLNLLSQKGE